MLSQTQEWSFDRQVQQERSRKTESKINNQCNPATLLHQLRQVDADEMDDLFMDEIRAVSQGRDQAKSTDFGQRAGRANAGSNQQAKANGQQGKADNGGRECKAVVEQPHGPRTDSHPACEQQIPVRHGALPPRRPKSLDRRKGHADQEAIEARMRGVIDFLDIGQSEVIVVSGKDGHMMEIDISADGDAKA